METSLHDELFVIIPKPSPFALCRIGGDGDGAYLVPEDLVGVRACFSPGVANFKNFEDELTNRHGIRCHMCDFSSDVEKLRTPLIDNMQTFKKKWLDIDGSNESISLEEWVRELEPNENEDLILQMDIEGAEYRNLISCPEAILNRFRIIVLELHGLGVCRKAKEFEKELGPLLRKLDKLFVCVHAHPNNCCGDFMLPGSELNIPNVIELTFLRKDRLSKGGELLIPPMLPHPLDISWNTGKNPPLFLNEKWSQYGVRSSESTVKMLRDELRYWKKVENNTNTAETILNLHIACQNIVKRLRGDAYNLSRGGKSGSDVAEGKRFLLSSGYGNFSKEGLVRNKSPFFFHTGFGANQSITIDLERECELESLVIGNRTNTCLDRARCIFYVTHNTPEPDFSLGLPVAVDKDFITGKNAKCTTPLMNAHARYLTIFSPENTALHFESICIFGIKYGSL